MPPLPTPGGLPASPSIHDMPMPTPGVDPSQLRTFGDVAETRRLIYANTLEAAKAIPAVSNTRFSLAVENPAYDGPEDFSPEQEKRAVLENRTLSRRLQADYVMRDHTGNEVDRRRMTIAHVPHLTNLGTFVYHGNAYPLINQLRLRPGVFARVKDNGEIESHINVAKGRAHRLSLDPETGVFRINIAQSHIPLMPLLQSLGATKKDVEDAWGPEIAAANYGKNDAKVMDKLYTRILGPNAAPAADNLAKTAAVVKAYQEMTLDPEVTSRTLGKPFKNLSSDVLLAATKKLIQLHRGETAPDDRDAPAFQKVLGPEDFFAEKFGLAGGVLRKALWKAAAQGSLAKAQPGGFTDLLNSVLTDSGLASAAEEVNPAELFDYQSRVTRMGKGGIPSETAIPAEARAVQPTYLGYIDPVRTPESSRTGVDLRFARAARKGPNGQIYTPVRDAKTGQLSYKSPQELAESVLGFPGHTDPDEPVPVIKGGRMAVVPKEEVTHYVPEFEDAFSPLGNLIPLKSMLKGQRAVMAARMMTQALPLQDAEAPFVRSATPEDANQSFEEAYSKHMGAVRAPHAARVVAVSPSGVTLADQTGKRTEYPLYSRFPYNRKSFLDQTPVVKVGDIVQPNQLLATSNFTDKDGALALGRNLRVGYLPYAGSIAADTHVLWYDHGQPRYTQVREVVPGPHLAALATDPLRLTTAVLSASGFSAHASPTLLRIKTSSGRILRATPEHSFVVLGDDGTLKEVTGDKLVVGESYIPRLGEVTLPVTTTTVTLPANKIAARTLRLPLSDAFGFLCGMYVAEGNVASNKAVSWAATDPKTREAISSAIREVFGDVCINTNSPHYIRLSLSSFAQWLKRHGGHLAHNKRVPDIMFGAPLSVRRAFICGFWLGDGRVHVKEGVPNATDTLITSRNLRDGLGLLLASMAISTTHGEYDDPKCTHGKTYALRISMRDAHRMPDLRGLHTDKGERLAAVIASYKDTGLADMVPVFAEAAASREILSSCHGAIRQKLRQSLRVCKTVSRRTVLSAIPPDTTDLPSQRLRMLAASSLEWDCVEEITSGPCDDWVYDFDMAPLRTFVCVDTLVVHNSNFEDAYIISESAAKKLTSHNMYQHSREWDDQSRQGKQTFTGIFPSKYDKATLANFTDDGVIKPGTKVKFGDPLVLAVRERDMNKKSLLGGRAAFTDDSETWEHHSPGEVTDVAVTPKGVNVVVKASSPMQEADKMCFDDQTRVLTKSRSWVSVKDVQVGEFVWTLNRETECGEWQPVTHTWAYDHDGPMYELVTKQVDMLVTLNHKIWAAPRGGAFGEVTAEQLWQDRRRWRFKKDCKWIGEDRKTHEFTFARCYQTRTQTLSRVDMADWCEFLGYYLAEGWVCLGANGKPGYVKIGQFETSAARDCIAACLDRMGLSYRYETEFGRFELGNVWLAEELAPLGDSYSKFVPEYIQELSPRLLRIFLNAYMAGDGHKGACWEYGSSSKRLAYDIQLVCMKLGWAVSVKEQNRTDNWAKHPHWRGRINRKHLRPVWQKGREERYPSTREAVIPFSGKVYCITVPNHIIYVERGDKSYWSLNSGRYG